MVFSMRAPQSTPVLAIDGGGTRCRIAFARDTSVTSVEAGSANVSTDFDGSVSEILKGLQKLGQKLGIQPKDLHERPAFVGLAGVTGPDMARRLQGALPLQHARITDDRPAALRGALDEADGCLAHCGTGSFFGVQRDGQQRFIGGWGSVLGDEASAMWIGRSALSATLESVDGLRAPSELSDLLLSKFEGATGIVAFAANAEPADFGALARHVTELGVAQDKIALDVMRAGAAQLVRVLNHLGWKRGRPVCLTGGLGPYFEPYLPEDMRQDVTAPNGTPLEGAISLAFEFAREVNR